MVTVKVSTADMCGLAPLQVWERALMNATLYGFSIEMYAGNLIGRKYCVRNFNENILKYISSSTIQMSQITCNCIHELNVFED